MPRSSFAARLRKLIAAPSISSVNAQWDQSNSLVIDLLAEWFADRGFTVEKLPIPGHKDKYNLVANLGYGPDGLVLSGHSDTVPYDQGKWQQDPFTLWEENGRFYGLGTADMKSFFPLVLEAIDGLDLNKLRNPLTLLATADEESTMCGAQSLIKTHSRLGRYALIGEPTGLIPVRMHKGIAMESIKLVGRSGHSSDPSLGCSALEGMQLVMGTLLAWRDELQHRYSDTAFKVPVPTLNLGHIHGGDNPNRICAECELQFDLRPLPGMQLDELRGELRNRITLCLADTGLEMNMRPLFPGIPAMETPATAAIVRTAEQLTGHTAGAVAFGTEGPYFNQIGMETIVLGPGNIDQAHQPNEYLAIERIDPYVSILRRVIQRFCF